MSNFNQLKSELRKLATKKRARASQWFFKTGKGDYGEGDKFLGVDNPGMRKVAKKFLNLSFAELKKLLNSDFHEERQTALFILVQQYETGDKKRQNSICRFYLSQISRVNNWDLVDLSCHYILGDYLLDKPRKILYKLAESKNLWARRIAIISTFAFIREKEFKNTLRLAKILLNDQHDLIQKGVGLMLREVGKRDKIVLENFLKKYHNQMPRTMLRYAIEKFSQAERRFYLKS